MLDHALRIGSLFELRVGGWRPETFYGGRPGCQCLLIRSSRVGRGGSGETGRCETGETRVGGKHTLSFGIWGGSADIVDSNKVVDIGYRIYRCIIESRVE